MSPTGLAPYSVHNAQRTGSTQTMTTKIAQFLLIGVLLSAPGAYADGSIEMRKVDGKPQASFSLGDSKCLLVNDTIRCTPVVVASN
jgi:hypothetical protein